MLMAYLNKLIINWFCPSTQPSPKWQLALKSPNCLFSFHFGFVLFCLGVIKCLLFMDHFKISLACLWIVYVIVYVSVQCSQPERNARNVFQKAAHPTTWNEFKTNSPRSSFLSPMSFAVSPILHPIHPRPPQSISTRSPQLDMNWDRLNGLCGSCANAKCERPKIRNALKCARHDFPTSRGCFYFCFSFFFFFAASVCFSLRWHFSIHEFSVAVNTYSEVQVDSDMQWTLKSSHIQRPRSAWGKFKFKEVIKKFM